jgi:threonine/homoserine/homoserine lactone efflux protein
MKSDREKAEAQARAGRRAALVVVATGVFWIGAMWIGPQLGLTQRVRALFDLIALAGFGLGLWMTYQAWRIGQ